MPRSPRAPSAPEVARRRLLQRLEAAWSAFRASYAGLSDPELLEPGVTGNWSVRDLIAHVTWWEEEALKVLPLVLAGGRLPRYSAMYGGIDAFNAMKTEGTRGLSLAEVLRRHEEVHARVVALVTNAPESEMAAGTRFRRRLRLDTYGHYPKHAEAIRAWRERRAGPRR
jgi:hypothetical protein